MFQVAKSNLSPCSDSEPLKLANPIHKNRKMENGFVF